MKLGSRQAILGAVVAMLLCLVAIVSAGGQGAPARRPATAPANRSAASGQATPARRPATAAQGPLMAEQVYKDIRVLRGLSEDQFMDTMGFIASGIGANCAHCHSIAIAGSTAARWAGFAVDTPNKTMARKMILMVNTINKANFGGQKVVTCYTCHHGLEDPPKVIPDMDAQYGPPDEREPDQIVRQDPDAPPPDQILDKYIAAIGGATRVATLKSFTATGTYSGYDTDFEAVPMNIYGKAPGQHAFVMHTPFGERSEIFNGTAGWNATPDFSQVRPVLPITGGRLVSQKVMAQLAFPSQIKQILTRWRTGPLMTISGGEPGATDVKDREVYVVQGTDSGNLPVKLYFDKESGLLVRVVSYVDTAIGMIPAQTDYSDYRDVSGIKMPFHFVATWTDGQSVNNLTDVQVNAPIEDAKFDKPAPPKLLTPPSR